MALGPPPAASLEPLGRSRLRSPLALLPPRALVECAPLCRRGGLPFDIPSELAAQLLRCVRLPTSACGGDRLVVRIADRSGRFTYGFGGAHHETPRFRHREPMRRSPKKRHGCCRPAVGRSPTNGPKDLQEMVFSVFCRRLYREWFLFFDDCIIATGRAACLPPRPPGVADTTGGFRMSVERLWLAAALPRQSDHVPHVGQHA